jgi:hypothetical protein
MLKTLSTSFFFSTPCRRNQLKPLFFQVVDVKPVIDHAIARHKVADVILHVLLEFQRQLAQAQVAFFVVPGNDLRTRTFSGVLANPRGDLIVGCARGDERLECVVVNFGELQSALIQRAVGVVFALPAGEHSAAFVHGASGQDVASQRFARAARVLFAATQIARQQLHFFQVCFHGFLPSFSPTAADFSYVTASSPYF